MLMNVNMSFGLLDIDGKILKPQIKSNRRNSDALIQLIVSLSADIQSSAACVSV